MKKFPLQDIELHIDDAIIEQAEHLLQSDALLKLEELQPYLWTASFEGEPSVESEIQLGRKNVKASSCDCPVFHQHGICVHIAASLLRLRQLQQQKKQQKAQQQRRTKSSSKLTTAAILRQVEQHALKEFVRDYARNNRPFALAFKARFAQIIRDIDDDFKYQHLISSIIGTIKRPGAKLSKTGLRQINQLLDELHQQADTALQAHNLREAFSIIQAVLEQIPPTLLRNVDLPDKLIHRMHDYIQLSEDLLEQLPAPSLTASVLTMHLEVFDTTFFLEHALYERSLLLFLKEFVTSSHQMALIERLNQALQNAAIEEEVIVQLLYIKLQLHRRLDQELHQQLEGSSSILHRPAVLLQITRLAEKEGHWVLLYQLAEWGLSIDFPQAVHNSLRKSLLESAIHQKATPSIRKWAKEVLLLAYDIDGYLALKNTYKKSWPNQLSKLLQQISRQPDSALQTRLLAEIYQKEQQYSDLLQLIRHTKALELLKYYDKILMDQDPKATTLLYEDLLNDYLSHHLGRQAALKVRQIIAHLHRQDLHQLAKQLVRKIRKVYGVRHSLMEELEIFR